MPAIGFGLVWLAYTAGLMGYCQIKGYDVSWSQLIRPSQAIHWPPGAKGVGRIQGTGSGPGPGAGSSPPTVIQA